MAEPTPTDLLNAVSDLHAAVLRGFAQIDVRFDRLETRVTSVEGDVRGIDHWMARADARFEALEARL